MPITDLEAQENIGNCIRFLASLSKETIGRFKTMETDLLNSASGERFVGTLGQKSALRADLAAMLNPPAVIPSFLRAQLLEYAEYVGLPLEVDDQSIIDEIYKEMHDNAQYVKSRNIDFGLPLANVGNTGDGVIYRLTVDEEGYAIESGFIESKKFVITRDQTDGNVTGRHNEIGAFTGEPRVLDDLELSDGLKSGLSFEFTIYSETSGILNNASFSDSTFNGSTLDTIDDWDVTGSINNFEIDEINYYRANDDVVTPASLRFKAVDSISQSLANVSISRFAPYFITFVYNRQIGAAPAGTVFYVQYGSVIYTFPALLGTETGWKRVAIPVDESTWPNNWLSDQPKFKIGVSTLASGFINIDEVLMVQMLNVDSTYYVPIGGRTPFEFGDEFTWDDVLVSTDSIIQRYFALSYKRHLPHIVTPSHTWPEPVLP